MLHKIKTGRRRPKPQENIQLLGAAAAHTGYKVGDILTIKGDGNSQVWKIKAVVK